jgi:hypothetical protein
MNLRWMRGLALAVMAAALVACGGGNGGSGATPPVATVAAPEAPSAAPAAPAPQPEPAASPGTPVVAADARNGDYPLYTTIGVEYLLTLDFDRQAWRITGNGSDQAGALRATPTEFELRTPDASTRVGHFILRSDTVVGSFLFLGNSNLLPFIAARSFVNSVAEAAGNYVVFESTDLQEGGRQPNGVVTFAALQDGWLGAGILPSSVCGSSQGPVTANGSEFTWTVCGRAQRFRVARVGNDKVLLLAGPIGQFALPVLMIGLHESATFAPGNSRVTFSQDGTNSDRWADVSITADQVHMVATQASGTPLTSDSTFHQGLVATPPVRWYWETPTQLNTAPWTYVARTPDITLMETDLLNNRGSRLAFGLTQP